MLIAFWNPFISLGDTSTDLFLPYWISSRLSDRAGDARAELLGLMVLISLKGIILKNGPERIFNLPESIM